MQKKIIIVGNGASVLDNKNGALIDSFDIVVRINDFKTDGFEEYTGIKTDILFTCRLDTYNHVDLISKFPEVILSFLCDPWNDIYTKQEVLQSKNITDSLNWTHVAKLRDKLGMCPPKYPSTGLICIEYMIQRYSHVTITGFDNFKGGNRHYYEEGERMDPSPHAPERQEIYLELLERLGSLSRL